MYIRGRPGFDFCDDAQLMHEGGAHPPQPMGNTIIVTTNEGDDVTDITSVDGLLDAVVASALVREELVLLDA